MSVVEITIDGSTVTPDRGTFQIERQWGSRHLCSLDWSDPTGTGIEASLGDEVIVTNTSAGREFGGLVEAVHEAGLIRPSLAGVRRSITAKDFSGYCDQRVVTASWSTATLYDILADLTSDYLSTFGVSLSSAQSTGPVMGDLTYEYRMLTDVLNDLAVRSGRNWNLSYTKVLLMTTAGATTAPAEITSTNRVALSVDWEQTRENYANRQYISYGPSGSQVVSDYWTATTGQQDFPLHYSDVEAFWIAYEGVAGYPVGGSSTDGTLYYFDASSHVLVRTSSGIASGTAVSFQIQVPFPQITYAETTEHADDPHELVNTLSALADGTDYAAAQALAAAQLTAVGDGSVKRVTFTTRTPGWQVGQVVTITLPDRGLSGSHLITSVIATHDPDSAEEIRYTVDCVSGDYSQGSFLDTYRQWSGLAGTAGSIAVGGGISSTATYSALHAHLGGARLELVASTAYTPIANHVTFTAPVTGTYTFRTERIAQTTNVTATVRLYDVTSTAEVSGSASTESYSTAWTEASASVSLEAGHQYRVEILGNSTTLGVACGQATVEL